VGYVILYIIKIIFIKFQKIVDDKQNNEKLINKINEYEINIAADKQSIQQLTCKIKDLEEERSAKGVEYDLQKLGFEGNDQLHFFKYNFLCII